MTDLRQAAQQALEALQYGKPNKAITILREALEQPEQEPSQWRDMIVVSLVRENVNKHRARELADHFAAQRPWQGLTEDDRCEFAAAQYGWEDLLIAAEGKLKERNHD